jgi:hypothetical protein
MHLRGLKKPRLPALGVVADTRSKRIPLPQRRAPSRSMICWLGGAGPTGPNGCRGLCDMAGNVWLWRSDCPSGILTQLGNCLAEEVL